MGATLLASEAKRLIRSTQFAWIKFASIRSFDGRLNFLSHGYARIFTDEITNDGIATKNVKSHEE